MISLPAVATVTAGAHSGLYDTQYDMIAGVAGIPDGDREDWCGQRLGVRQAHVPFCQP